MRELIITKIKPNMVFENPGKGISTVISCTDTSIYYKRGNSKIQIKYNDIIDAYKQFVGKTVSTKDFKIFNPKVFDTKNGGHDCNCTFLFLVLKEMGCILKIEGAGRRNSPFYAIIN